MIASSSSHPRLLPCELNQSKVGFFDFLSQCFYKRAECTVRAVAFYSYQIDVLFNNVCHAVSV